MMAGPGKKVTKPLTRPYNNKVEYQFFTNGERPLPFWNKGRAR